MKIREIRTYLMQVGAPPLAAWAADGSFGSHEAAAPSSRNWLFVRVVTDQGVTGIGECSGWPRVVETAVKDLAPLLIGEDPADIERLCQKMHIAMMGHGLTSVVGWGAISGLEMALWDIKGKVLKTPVWNLLGGRLRDRIRIYSHAGTPAVAKTWAEVAAANGADGITQEVSFTVSGPTFPFGAHLAVVEVDTETGRVKLIRHVACDDAGRVINPLLLEGQIHGGIAQGAAQALLEEVRYDGDGNPITGNLADYAFISAAELPSFEVVAMETPTPINPLGAKGIGESGSIGSTPAIQSAVVDAVSHLGVTHIDMPATPERVWRAIADAR